MPNTYDKLLDKLADVVLAGIGPHRDKTIWQEAAHQQMIPFLNAIWPEIVEELAKIHEYEHALEHVAEEHIPQCDGCRTLAQSALDGLNRDMCRELVINDE